MAASSTVIANMALKHLKVNKEIANLTLEQSPEAQALRAFYDTAREECLKATPWTFAKKFVTLALVSTDPNLEWGYVYRYPSDCINFRRILSGIRNDSRISRVRFLIGADDAGQLIYTDKAQAVGEYTFLNAVEESYPGDFVMALSLYIAHLIAPAVMGGDPFKLGDRALNLFIRKISEAAASSVNEEATDPLPESEFITGR